jgi:hypothetical protein
MKTELILNKLLKRHGTWPEVAKVLGITPRHLLNIRKGQHVGRFLLKMIQRMV